MVDDDAKVRGFRSSTGFYPLPGIAQVEKAGSQSPGYIRPLMRDRGFENRRSLRPQYHFFGGGLWLSLIGGGGVGVGVTITTATCF